MSIDGSDIVKKKLDKLLMEDITTLTGIDKPAAKRISSREGEKMILTLLQETNIL